MAVQPVQVVKNDIPQSTIKLVLYDFDQTITTIHLYHQLSHNNDQLAELSKMNDKRLIEVFGGKNRIKRLNEHFNKLISNKIEIGIISYGYVNVIKKALQRMNLFQYFQNSVIIGGDSKELEDADQAKHDCITNEFKNKRLKLNKNNILFVDDDQYNINDANDDNVCKTLLINPRNGMSNNHMDYIENQCIIKKNINNNNNNNNDNDNQTPNDK